MTDELIYKKLLEFCPRFPKLKTVPPEPEYVEEPDEYLEYCHVQTFHKVPTNQEIVDAIAKVLLSKPANHFSKAELHSYQQTHLSIYTIHENYDKEKEDAHNRYVIMRRKRQHIINQNNSYISSAKLLASKDWKAATKCLQAELDNSKR